MDFLDSLEVLDSAQFLKTAWISVWFGTVWYGMVWFGMGGGVCLGMF